MLKPKFCLDRPLRRGPPFRFCNYFPSLKSCFALFQSRERLVVSIAIPGSISGRPVESQEGPFPRHVFQCSPEILCCPNRARIRRVAGQARTTGSFFDPVFPFSSSSAHVLLHRTTPPLFLTHYRSDESTPALSSHLTIPHPILHLMGTLVRKGRMWICYRGPVENVGVVSGLDDSSSYVASESIFHAGGPT
ncbi:hypothetical protein M413DRAFT_345951 [Hebeloma cylindrosporum]|uniref:Uncharacterized protein n=1 Tax=Hebeloma cylindrosporum TaxID=76867 RepID=A0A0C2YXM6_HEBCY|nr:hypothetical protein M413DRAFT_345951 [Hebeloma cylindrosporum h7]